MRRIIIVLGRGVKGKIKIWEKFPKWVGLLRKTKKINLRISKPREDLIFQKCQNYKLLSDPLLKKIKTLNVPIFNLNMPK